MAMSRRCDGKTDREQKNISDQWDERWPTEFLPTLNNLVAEANRQRYANSSKASELYLRANALGHIAHYPALNTPLRYSIYETQIAAFLNGTSFWQDPFIEVLVPHTHRVDGEGSTIPVFYRSAPRNFSRPLGVIVRMTGVDGFRPDQPGQVATATYNAGYASIVVEIPGTGASPALPLDPESPDRLWSSIIDWIEEQPEVDSSNIVFWGVSTGGYYGLRVAYTHATRIKGAVAQGAWSHCAVNKTWLDIADVGEYPTILSKTLAWKFRYNSTEQLYRDAQNRFSLVDGGIVNMTSGPLLIVNGMEDTIFPIEDSMVMLEYGTPKTARWVRGAHHSGEPVASTVIFPWLKALTGR
ncbi:alpha/beta-hydrolase [Aulographum hederae CBS 113979]|uniref:Alpha/beta-hydrolase n=1 Tax=Aulographum hederae CBS 113979 TaxID=1176131 RepID=A0A6G1GKQ4_9PEZI|nr:alpha/beta-hydrolase [Aulographum hederae CBS 113979]